MGECGRDCLRCAGLSEEPRCDLNNTRITRVHAEVVLEEDAALEMWRDTTAESDLTPNLISEPDTITIVETDDGPQVALGRLPRQVRGEYRRAIRGYPMGAGVVRAAGIRNRAQVFGNLSRQPVLGRMACCASSGALSHPDEHQVIVAAAAFLASMLKVAVPEQYEFNQEVVSEVRPEWLLPGGLWTSGVINDTSVFPYHRDRNNFPGAWSAMPVIRRHTRGGHLHFPELEIEGQPAVAACGDGDVLLFNGQRWMHGVTPIERTQSDGYRMSAVYYPVRKMKNCLEPQEELRQAQIARTHNEDTLLERQRASGTLKDVDDEN